MKLLILAFLICIFTVSSSATIVTATQPRLEAVTNPPVNLTFLSQFSTKQIEQIIGRKLTMTEKVRWFFAKKTLTLLQNEEDEIISKKARTKAYMGFGFSIAGLLIPLLSIPGLIFSNQALSLEKQTPGLLKDAKGFAQAGQIMGWVGIGLFILLILYVILLISFLSSWG